MRKLLKSIASLIRRPKRGNKEPTGSPCCNTLVHIAYRGVSDERLYLVRDKKWSEVKFFRPNGLRVYCQKCRQRVL